MKDFEKDLKQWVKEVRGVDDCECAISLYDRGYITLHEAVNLIEKCHANLEKEIADAVQALDNGLINVLEYDVNGNPFLFITEDGLHELTVLRSTKDGEKLVKRLSGKNKYIFEQVQKIWNERKSREA